MFAIRSVDWLKGVRLKGNTWILSFFAPTGSINLFVSLLTKLHMHCISLDERPLGKATCLGLGYGIVEFSVRDATEYSDFFS
jgi:hypothetical protein